VNRGRLVPCIAIAWAVFVTTALAQIPAKTNLPSAYQKWLDEDVVYIITPEERTQYLQLSTEKDRNQFIVQFWENRNPVPGTPENTFKEEHYRRIAYSNVHFADSRPGWETDRGRVYIVYGPPNEIKDVAPLPYRAQIWRYDSGQEFRFVDACECGRYELARPKF